MKNGFTLVELSIVLVIIGLLVGGILVGQSLIDSVNTQRFVREVQQYTSMVDQFESRYRSIPGDTSLFPVTARGVSVANDKFISDGSGPQANGRVFESESAHFWKHLSDSGIATEQYSSDASSGVIVGEHTPEIVYENAYLMPVNAVAINPITLATTNRIVYYFRVQDYSSSNSTTINGGVPEPVLSNSEALAIDVKIDDGFAATDILAGGPQDKMFSLTITDCWQSTSVFPKFYDVQNNSTACLLEIKFK